MFPRLLYKMEAILPCQFVGVELSEEDEDIAEHSSDPIDVKVELPAETDNNLEIAPRPFRSLKCFYCGKYLLTATGAHAIGCKSIEKLQEKIKCPYCDNMYRESVCWLHQVRCEENPNRVLNSQEHVYCPKCNKLFVTMKSLRRHLSTSCLLSLIRFTKKSLEESSRPRLPVKIPITAISDSYADNGTEQSLSRHWLASWKSWKSKRRKRKCPHCCLEFEESLSYVHEVKCSLNTRRLDVGKRAYTCPKCKNATIRDNDEFRIHLGNCRQTEEVQILERQISEPIVVDISASDKEEVPMLKSKKRLVATTVTCPFCKDKFNSLEDLKQSIVKCRGIKSREPKVACEIRGCGLKLPLTLVGMHEKICAHNKYGFLQTENNLK